MRPPNGAPCRTKSLANANYFFPRLGPAGTGRQTTHKKNTQLFLLGPTVKNLASHSGNRFHGDIDFVTSTTTTTTTSQRRCCCCCCVADLERVGCVTETPWCQRLAHTRRGTVRVPKWLQRRRRRRRSRAVAFR